MDLRLQRFAIEDCLIGAINPRMRYLGRSFEINESGQDVSSIGASDSLSRALQTPQTRPSTEASRHASTPGIPTEPESDDDMQSAHSEFASGQFDSLPSSAAADGSRSIAAVVPLAEMVRCHFCLSCSDYIYHTCAGLKGRHCQE